MRKTTLFLISLAFALVAVACGSSDSESVSVTGGSGDQVADTPATPAPDDEAGETPTTPAPDGQTARGSQTAEDDQTGAAPAPEDQAVEAPASPTPDDQPGESGTSSSSEADEDDRTTPAPSAANSSEDRTEDGTEDNTGNMGSGSSSTPAPTPDGDSTGTPSPDSSVSVSPDEVDNATPTATPTPVVPQEGRAPAYVEDVTIVVRESWPMQVAVIISGGLPSPCNELRWSVEPGATTTEDDWTVAANGSVHTITVWSTPIPPGYACATVIEPFSQQVELGRFVSGDYTVVVNGEHHPISL